ncbi:MAG: AsmA family protein, partial [Terriglobales bacterium]
FPSRPQEEFAVKTGFKVVGIVIVLFLVVAIGLPFLVNVNHFRPQIESNLSAALARPVKVGNLSLSVFSGSVGADQLAIADDPRFGSAPFIQAKSLRVGVALLPLIFSKQLNVLSLTIDRPAIHLLRNPEGVWNFSSLGNQPAQPVPAPGKTAAAPAPVNVAKVDLTDGVITLGSFSSQRNPLVYDKVNVSVRNFSLVRAFPVIVSASLPAGGSLKIDGSAGPINPTDTALTPGQAKVKLGKLDLAQSAVVDPGLGIAGLADIDANVKSDGNIVKAAGTFQGRSLQLAPKGSPAASPVQVVFVVEHDLRHQTGRLAQADVAIGKALATLKGSYDMHGETASIDTTLNGQAMPIDDLVAMLPALAVNLPTGSQLKGGTLSIELHSTGPLNRLLSTGWVKINNTTLTGFNLASKLSAVAALTGKQVGNDTTIQNFSSDVRYAPEGTRLDTINLVIPSLGTVTGAGTVSPSHALDFNMVANLAGPGAGLTRIAGAGSGGIPVNIGGTTSNPTFTPDMKGVAGSKVKGLTPGGKTVGGLGGLLGKKPN